MTCWNKQEESWVYFRISESKLVIFPFYNYIKIDKIIVVIMYTRTYGTQYSS